MTTSSVQNVQWYTHFRTLFLDHKLSLLEYFLKLFHEFNFVAIQAYGNTKMFPIYSTSIVVPQIHVALVCRFHAT